MNEANRGASVHTVCTDWIHIRYEEKTAFTETYGFSGNQGSVNLEGLLLRPKDRPSRTLLIFMHPSSTLQLLPLPRDMVAREGVHVLCAASRYAKNDTALILEKVLLDLGAYIRHAREVLGYEHVVLGGWSGGGALAMFYQEQAESPTITHTPAADPIDLVGAGLIPADGIVYQAAHLSRARLLVDMIDPSVRNELDPDDRDASLDIYDPANPNQPPYTSTFISHYRQAQLDRMRRITARVKNLLGELRARKTGELERGFIVHRTLADPRFLDPALDPNGRRPRWCYLGNPETVNTGPVGLARFSTLRSWLSQWSIDDSKGDALSCAQRVKAPLLVIENGADDAVPQPHPRQVYEASLSADKQFQVIEGATHYYAGQPAQLAQAIQLITGWMSSRGMRP
jgi:pimeloyl-ACP methyl ester carboxylesterase